MAASPHPNTLEGDGRRVVLPVPAISALCALSAQPTRYLFLLYTDASLQVLDCVSEAIVGYRLSHLHWPISSCTPISANLASLSSSVPPTPTPAPSLLLTASHDATLGVWCVSGAGGMTGGGVRFVDIPSLLHPNQSTLTLAHHTLELSVCAVACHEGSGLLALVTATGVLVVCQPDWSTVAVTSQSKHKEKGKGKSEGGVSLLGYWDISQQVATSAASPAPVRTLAWNQAGDLLLASYADASVRLWWLQPPQLHLLALILPGVPLTDVVQQQPYYFAQFISKSSELHVGSGENESVDYVVCSSADPSCLLLLRVHYQFPAVGCTYLAATPSLLHEMWLSHAITSCVLHPSHNYVLLTTTQGALHLLQLNNATLVGGVLCAPEHSACVALAVDPSGLYAAVGIASQSEESKSSPRGWVKLYHVPTASYIGRLPRTLPFHSLHFAPSAPLLFAHNTHGGVEVWRLPAPLADNMAVMLAVMEAQPLFYTTHPLTFAATQHTQSEMDGGVAALADLEHAASLSYCSAPLPSPAPPLPPSRAPSTPIEVKKEKKQASSSAQKKKPAPVHDKEEGKWMYNEIALFEQRLRISASAKAKKPPPRKAKGTATTAVAVQTEPSPSKQPPPQEPPPQEPPPQEPPPQEPPPDDQDESGGFDPNKTMGPDQLRALMSRN